MPKIPKLYDEDKNSRNTRLNYLDHIDPEVNILDDTELAQNVKRTAESTGNAVIELKDITDNINKLYASLEAEKQLRQESEKKHEKTNKRIERIAIITLIANWGAVALTVLFRFL